MVSEILVKRLLHLRRACAVGGAAAEARLQKKISLMADRMAGCNVEVAKCVCVAYAGSGVSVVIRQAAGLLSWREKRCKPFTLR